jgi:hypothetical protein
MGKPLIVALPPNLDLGPGNGIRVTALDPATGAVVPGVRVANVTIEVALTSGDATDLQTGPFLLVTGPKA